MVDLFALLENKILWVSLLAWCLAQAAKIIINFMVEGKWDFNLLIGSGGFPSSHTAIVCALAVSIGKAEGLNSSMFAVAVALAMIVMYDAAGVRRATGNHARVINYLIEWARQLQADRLADNLQQERLKELIGHTPFEVFGGAILGCLIGFIF